MDFKRTVSVNQGLDLSSEESRSTLYVMLSELGACNMRPIGSKVISEFHRFKDEIVSKLASQNSFNSFPHLLADFFRHARAFSKDPPPSHEDFPNHHVWNSIDLNVSDQVQNIFRYFLRGGSNIYVVSTEMDVNALRRELEQSFLAGFIGVLSCHSPNSKIFYVGVGLGISSKTGHK